MRILVVGGAGYIGSHMCLELAARGHVPVIYDNFSTGFRRLTGEFPVIEANISDRAALSRALAGMDAVIHFAGFANVGESVRNPRKYFANNVEGSLALLDAVIDSNVRKVVFSSTCATYGEPQCRLLREDASQMPLSPYGASKLFIERALKAYRRPEGLQAVALRYFNAAGADPLARCGEMHDPETHLIPLALMASAGMGEELTVFGDDFSTPDGTCIRDYVHVHDLARGHLAALHFMEDGDDEFAFNLGTGQGHSVRQVMQTIERVTGRKVPHRMGPRREGDPSSLVADPQLANEKLGWQARYALEEIIETAWQWLKKWKGL